LVHDNNGAAMFRLWKSANLAHLALGHPEWDGKERLAAAFNHLHPICLWRYCQHLVRPFIVGGDDERRAAIATMSERQADALAWLLMDHYGRLLNEIA
jgi:hypothetical protein